MSHLHKTPFVYVAFICVMYNAGVIWFRFISPVLQMAEIL